MSLSVHDLRTGKAQLHPGIGVDGVVDTAVVGAVAPGHAAVGGIDNGIALERCNIALPEIQPRLQGRKVCHIRDALCGGFLLQIFVLYLQKVRAAAPWCTDIQQAPQKLALTVCICRNAHIPVFRVFLQKRPDQKQPPLTLVHSQTLFSIVCLGQTSAHRPQ